MSSWKPMWLGRCQVVSKPALPLALLCAMAAPSTCAASWVVQGIGGGRIDLSDRSKKAVVLLFVAHDCPISNGYAPEINRLYARYSAKGMTFCLVYPEAGLSVAQARRHAREYGYRFPAVMDAAHRLVRRTQVSVTPEVAVLAPSGKLLYRGRIDDRYAALGKARPKVARPDLRLALDAILAGKPVKNPLTAATGCYIE